MPIKRTNNKKKIGETRRNRIYAAKLAEPAASKDGWPTRDRRAIPCRYSRTCKRKGEKKHPFRATPPDVADTSDPF